MNKRIFMTGATGFFGKNLFLHLPELSKYDYVVLSREQRPGCIQGDIRDFKFPTGEFDYIIHGATTSSKIIPDDETRSVIIDGTKRILEFAKTQPAKFMYISSGAVYGPGQSVSKETDKCLPTTVYGESKLKAEKMVMDVIEDPVIVRCFAFVGEYLPLEEHFAIGNFIKCCLDNKPIVVTGDGTPIRSYMYTGDLANWLWRLLLDGSGIYNVGGEHVLSIGDLARMVKEVAESKEEVHVLGKPVPWQPAVCYAPNVSRARKFGLRESVSLEEAIRKTLEFYKKGG